MVAFENTVNVYVRFVFHSMYSEKERVLVICVTDPRKRAAYTNGHHDVCNHTHDEHRVVVIFMVDKYQRYAEDKPNKP